MGIDTPWEAGGRQYHWPDYDTSFSRSAIVFLSCYIFVAVIFLNNPLFQDLENLIILRVDRGVACFLQEAAFGEHGFHCSGVIWRHILLMDGTCLWAWYQTNELTLIWSQYAMSVNISTILIIISLSKIMHSDCSFSFHRVIFVSRSRTLAFEISYCSKMIPQTLIFQGKF